VVLPIWAHLAASGNQTLLSKWAVTLPLPIAALLLTACTAHAQPAEKLQAQVQFERGLGFLLIDDYAAAAATFERLYAATGSERVRLEWARASYLQQDYEQAETLFKAVLAADPPFPVREKIRYF
jgi:tetratricopeptide (TPR) repeat protein